MTGLKAAGAAMILGASTWTGLGAARSLRSTERMLGELIAALDRMENEVRFHRTAFPELCGLLSRQTPGRVGTLFRRLGEMARDGLQRGSTAAACAAAQIRLPDAAQPGLERLLDGFGDCDAEGQLRLIEACRSELERAALRERQQLDSRCRLCRLLGFCGGAALTILVI